MPDTPDAAEFVEASMHAPMPALLNKDDLYAGNDAFWRARRRVGMIENFDSEFYGNGYARWPSRFERAACDSPPRLRRCC